ncbi:MAG: NAD(P)H-hydrate dehydratase [Candidatus Aenigmatarchaeota archaeon]|nr:MAG: NAD(P)H-hydrate dehydratase [Candidatus Aenigmarchaeota archaeon]
MGSDKRISMEVTRNILKEVYRKRDPESHKGDFGRLLVVGGSMVYSGSPALVALAAYRSGVDLVRLAAPERAANIAATFSPDLITYPLKGDHLEKNHIKTVRELEKISDAAVIGNGAGREKETLETLRDIIKGMKIPMVVDADALHVIDKKVTRNKLLILTPHLGEFEVMTGERPETLSEKKESVRRYAKDFGAVILLKGSEDVISDGEEIALNRTGSPYMTKGGTGDILAGICGSLLAQGVEPFRAACAAAWISGKAGDLVAKERGPSLMSSDMLDAIGRVVG